MSIALATLAAMAAHASPTGSPPPAPLPTANLAAPATPFGKPPARLRVLFLRAAFPDRPSVRPARDFSNAARGGLVDRMVAYFDEVSSRRFHVDPIVTQRVYTLPRPRAEYAGKTSRMVRDTLALATAPGAERDLILGSRPEAVVVFFSGPGAESDIKGSSNQNPWSEAIAGLDIPVAPGLSIDRAMVVAEDPFPPFSPFGVLCHEFGHLLGLPELYAPGHAHEGIGVWGLMGQGTWLGRGESPPHPSAWSKLSLGWVDATLIDKTTTVSLPAVEKSAAVVKIWAKGPEVPTEYFLIENRQRIRADRKIPGHGLLIWHVDETKTSFRRSQDDAKHKRIDLLTADAWPSHLDLGHTRRGNRGDAGDPWASRRLGPDPETMPSTGAYDGARGRFAIRDISPSGEIMTFQVIFEGEGAASRGSAPDRAEPVGSSGRSSPPGGSLR